MTVFNDINDTNNSFCIKCMLMYQALCWALERVSKRTHTLHLITIINIGGRNNYFL